MQGDKKNAPEERHLALVGRLESGRSCQYGVIRVVRLLPLPLGLQHHAPQDG